MGGLCGKGAWQGACMVGCVWQGGMHGMGHAWQGVCVAGVGACVAGEMATADGTHPTGMHSCFRRQCLQHEAWKSTELWDRFLINIHVGSKSYLYTISLKSRYNSERTKWQFRSFN